MHPHSLLLKEEMRALGRCLNWRTEEFTGQVERDTIKYRIHDGHRYSMWANKLEKPKSLVSLLHWCFNWQVRASTRSSSSTSIKGLCYSTTVSNLKMCKSLDSPLALKLSFLNNSGHSFWKSFIDFFLGIGYFFPLIVTYESFSDKKARILRDEPPLSLQIKAKF